MGRKGSDFYAIYRTGSRVESETDGLDMDLIEFCLKTGRVCESQYHHNAAFVGMDRTGKPRYAALWGIGTDYIVEANGSNKNYSFSIAAEGMSDTVHLFESAIDLFLTLLE